MFTENDTIFVFNFHSRNVKMKIEIKFSSSFLETMFGQKIAKNV
jgi:hypothetical protein